MPLKTSKFLEDNDKNCIIHKQLVLFHRSELLDFPGQMEPLIQFEYCRTHALGGDFDLALTIGNINENC